MSGKKRAKGEYWATVVVEHRIVDEGEVVRAQRATSGIDLALYLVERIAGRKARIHIAKQMDYRYNELAHSVLACKQNPSCL